MSPELAEGGIIGVILSLAFTFLLSYIDRRVAQDQVLRGELYGAYHMRISELEATLAELKIENDKKDEEIARLREASFTAELERARAR